ncbi:hypothetical protein K402DRAFT_2224 [Aulographum hederae CBS 113979]|uniref:Uncharacterized protein n=1 Tax=Aulographum hederae CBS 113979 TaxID=1176131 RepID=A0A6G1HGW3_9PEZI|nr:hypothetical protein K402DRAFT_2224 [Aulographum hederae CBS 113979]
MTSAGNQFMPQARKETELQIPECHFDRRSWPQKAELRAKYNQPTCADSDGPPRYNRLGNLRIVRPCWPREHRRRKHPDLGSAVSDPEAYRLPNRSQSTHYQIKRGEASYCYTTYFVQPENYRLKIQISNFRTVNRQVYKEVLRIMFDKCDLRFIGSPQSALAFLHDHMSHLVRLPNFAVYYRFNEETARYSDQTAHYEALIPRIDIRYWRPLFNVFCHYVFGIRHYHVYIGKGFWAWQDRWERLSLSLFEDPVLDSRSKAIFPTKNNLRTFLAHAARIRWVRPANERTRTAVEPTKKPSFNLYVEDSRTLVPRKWDIEDDRREMMISRPMPTRVLKGCTCEGRKQVDL